jgi:hypothetical protein
MHVTHIGHFTWSLRKRYEEVQTVTRILELRQRPAFGFKQKQPRDTKKSKLTGINSAALFTSVKH